MLNKPKLELTWIGKRSIKMLHDKYIYGVKSTALKKKYGNFR